MRFIIGLESHPQYELGKRQMRGYSGMVSFCIKGGLANAKAFLQSLKVRFFLHPNVIKDILQTFNLIIGSPIIAFYFIFSTVYANW